MAPDRSRPPYYPYTYRPHQTQIARRQTRSGARPALVAAGAGLAAAALYVQARTRLAERDNPPVGRFLEVDGVRLHYVSRGAGDPVVLFHGDGTLVQDFALSGLVDLAAEKYRVIVFDRPGYGYSERPRERSWTPEQQAALFRKAFFKLGIEEPVVLGHSWGSLVALALGLDYPEAVRSLVLLSGYFYPTARADVALMSLPAIPVIGDAMRYTIAPLYSRLIWPRLVRRMFRPNPVPPHWRRFPKWMSLRPGQLRAAAQESALMIPSAARLSRRYQELTVPVVILAGSGDDMVHPVRHSSRLHRELPWSTLHIVPAVGHMVHHIVPDAVRAAIDEAFEMRLPEEAPQMDEIAADRAAFMRPA